MTTDQLVKDIIRAFQEGDVSQYEKHLREIDYDEPFLPGRFVSIWSVALNDETRDVRYIEVHSGGHQTSAFEVAPRTVLRTVYEVVEH